MKYLLGIVVLTLQVSLAVAQQPPRPADEDVLRDLGVFGTYGLGDLALTDIKGQIDPLSQLRRFFVEAKLPLTSTEERQLRSAIETAIQGLQGAKDDAAVRRANVGFTRSMFAVLAPDQQAALRRYMNEQIMLRGGFPALKLLLENAHTPLTDEQENQIAALYQGFNQKAEQLPRDANGTPEKQQLDKLETETLGNVIKLLTTTQRRALAASRLGTLNSRGRAPF